MIWRGSRPGAKGPVLAGSDSRLAPPGRVAEEMSVLISLGALLSAPLDLTALGSKGVRGRMYFALNGNWALNGCGHWLGAISLAPPWRDLGLAMPMVKKGILRPEWSLKVELQA